MDSTTRITPSHACRSGGLELSSGRRYQLTRPRIPGLPAYYVLALSGPEPSPEDVDELHALARRIGEALGRRHFGDPECYSLLYNAARTRRRPWAHVHILVARTVAEKRRCLLFLQLKHVLRWRRWPLLRRLLGGA